MLPLLVLVPVGVSSVLGTAFLFWGDSRPMVKSLGVAVFGTAVYLQFFSRHSLFGLLLQIALALVLVLWRKRDTMEYAQPRARPRKAKAMICPKCKSEYRQGFDRCADCDLPLVDSVAAHAVDDETLVVVLKTTDPTLLPVAESLLRAAEIHHVVQGAAGIHVFPLGAAASRVTNRLTGATILVRRRDFAVASALLEPG